MTAPDQLKMFLALLVGYVPILLVSIVALAVIAEQRQRAPEATRWALMGFGLILVLSIVRPLGTTLIQAWMINSYMPVAKHQWASGIFGIGSSVLEAVALSFLLVAAFAGRPRVGMPPPFPPV